QDALHLDRVAAEEPDFEAHLRAKGREGAHAGRGPESHARPGGDDDVEFPVAHAQIHGKAPHAERAARVTWASGPSQPGTTSPPGSVPVRRQGATAGAHSKIARGRMARTEKRSHFRKP